MALRSHYWCGVSVFLSFVQLFGFGSCRIGFLNSASVAKAVMAEPAVPAMADRGEGTKQVPPARQIPDVIRSVASDLDFYEVDRLIKLGMCESRFKTVCGEINHPDCTNTYNNSFDRGWFQISRKYHSEVSDECAVDIECATKESIRIIRKRGFDEWACNSLI